MNMPSVLGSRVRAVALVSAAAFLLVALAGCGSIERPKVSVEDLRWTGLSVDGAEFEVVVKVTNPNAFDVVAEHLVYTMVLDGIRAVEGRQIERASIGASSSTVVTVPLTLTWEGGAKALEAALEGGEHDWNLTGSVALRNGLVSKTFKFAEHGSFETNGETDDEDSEDL